MILKINADQSIPQDLKDIILNLLLQNSQAEKETANESAERFKAEKETAKLLSSLNDMSRDNQLMAPRAVIEYVVVFVMPQYNISGTNRILKWENFFTKTSIGNALMSCVLKANPLWHGNATQIASRIQGIYQYTSDSFHKHLWK
jgi:hypothetical protein